MDSATVRSFITDRIVHEQPGLAPGDVAPAATFEALDIDSMTLMDLVLQVEKQFDITIADEALGAIKTVDDLVELVITTI